MSHSIYRVVNVEQVGPYELCITFDDGVTQTIDFQPLLKGPLYEPLLDEVLFRQVDIDPEIHTLVWPNGADFDPATLHDWPKYKTAMIQLAKKWEKNMKNVTT
ncbi:DUF2442 domain-containing protein [candidate division KSB1 bacterium]|nr:DUF2442 domain-containing protein [candidate division KSB1 bacterium]